MTDDGGVVCSICQGDDDEATHCLECDHVFHARCIVDWFRRGHRECPLCRNVPQFSEEGMLCRARFKYMVGVVARRKSAPAELKRLIVKYRALKNKVQERRRELTVHRRNMRDVLRIQTSLRNSIRASYAKVRDMERVIGSFHSTEYPLPPLRVNLF